MCVGVRASHRHLLSDGVLLNVSSSGATYFMEPKEAVELNNMEVRLSNSQKAEENAILSLFTSEIARSEMEIKYLLDRIVEVDLAFARAAYAQWINGACPSFSCGAPERFKSNGSDYALSVHIEGIQHPLLLESSLRNFPDVLTPQIASSVQLDKGNAVVPIDIQIGCGTRVVVISGPNTGGKTASMKTLGLASLMSKAVDTYRGSVRSWKWPQKSHLSSLMKIGCGTDPSEGVALSASILEYLKDSVNLAVITTHYADLSCLKEKDAQFENAAMEFSLENLQPTYRILWGRTGDSNALKIAKSIGFDEKIIERAQEWVERLMPDKQQQWKGLLYQSLMEERNRLEAQAQAASSLHSEIMDLYRKGNPTGPKELKTAKSQLQTVVQEFENQLRTANADNFNSLIKKSESAISSIVEAHCLSDDFFVTEKDSSSYKPQLGEQVNVKGLGGKLATVVEAPGDDDETVLVQYGNIRVRVKKSNIIAIPVSERNAGTSSVRPLRRQGQRRRILRNASDADKNEEVSYGPLVQTSKNTVDLRGMRVEEASHHLNMAISARESNSVLFVIHGMGTGVVKECAIEILRNHPRVAKFEQESPMNYGCTVAYIK
ncbi:Endonuclease MutS2 [Vitis vinifera]|uniref:Endonuclease MutS2 n=1 Tax=Vitis vinifera TaxID=29760 RepID=A0A438IGG4_VITVI|nr:Endonuclease MutS2 [Vitis vinifera]